MAEELDQSTLGLSCKLKDLQRSYEEMLLAPTVEFSRQGDAVIIFAVNGSLFGLPLRDILKIVPAHAIVDVPGAPASVRGAISHQQEIISVLDLAKLLSLSSKQADTANQREWVLVLRPRTRQCGLLVDSLERLHKLEQKGPQPANTGTQPQIISDEIILNDRPIALLDTEQLIDNRAWRAQ